MKILSRAMCVSALAVWASSLSAQFPPVIGKLKPDAARKKLIRAKVGKDIGALGLAANKGMNREPNQLLSDGFPRSTYLDTDHAIGFIPMLAPGEAGRVPIIDPINATPDAALRNSAVTITLDRLRVWDYPGDGEHLVLMDFYGNHFAGANQVQDVHFTQIYRAREKQAAPVAGQPIFVNFGVGDGLQFKIYTVNVRNKNDQRAIDFLNSDVFRTGLNLINRINPVIPIVTQFAIRLTKTYAERSDNVPVQQIVLGLDLTNIPTRRKLAQGSYIIAQTSNQHNVDWSKWVFEPQSGRILNVDDDSIFIKANYFVISISKQPSSGNPLVEAAQNEFFKIRELFPD